jgi:tripartite-type tricarboxylate transporter receptor subunit TctC
LRCTLRACCDAPIATIDRELLMRVLLCVIQAFTCSTIGLNTGLAFAQGTTTASWPIKPIRILLPYAPGGGLDVVARVMAPRMSEQLGIPVIVENRPGGAGVIATELVARAVPDGYTLFASATDFTTNPALRPKLPYDPLKDFAFITQLASVQFIIGAHPSVPARTVKDLVALARSKPGHLTYGSSGIGGGPHFAGALFQSMAGIKWSHVPFKGAGPATIGVMSGEIDVVFAATIGLLEHARSGRVRAIAVTGPKRFATLPEVPTVAESGVPGYTAVGFYGMYAPAGTSADVVRRLYTEAGRALGAPEIKERLARAGNEHVLSTPEEFAIFIRNEIAKWARVAKDANIRAE